MHSGKSTQNEKNNKKAGNYTNSLWFPCNCLLLGHEIACHTRSHKNDHAYWKRGSYDLYKTEIVDYKNLMEDNHIKPVVGYRQPFLQTGGDNTYSVLKDNDFLYDSSLPGLPGARWWPFTLDYGHSYCAIEPCPQSKLFFFNFHGDEKIKDLGER